MRLSRSISLRILAILALVLTTFGVASANPMPGALYTTDATCAAVNKNIFDAKADVHIRAQNLPQGEYYVRVTEPSGAVLGTSAMPLALVTEFGVFAECYNVYALTNFADTTNPGGQYKVWVSQNAAFPANESKTDNFKVREQATTSKLDVVKFYDANADGINNDNQPITGWKINILDGWTNTNSVHYTPVSLMLAFGNYKVSEAMPVQMNWMATTPTWVNVTLPPNAYVEFGNLCVGAGGGKTLGFWSNKNGAAMLGADDLQVLKDLNLVNASGSAFDPADVKAFQSWLLSANATNMANMLSAQLAAMAMNVHNGLVSGSALIYAPGTMSANALGFATVGAVLAEANTSLGANPNTPSGHPARAYQEALKNALDNANNNKTFVQATALPVQLLNEQRPDGFREPVRSGHDPNVQPGGRATPWRSKPVRFRAFLLPLHQPELKLPHPV
jgi:hypothetical protein